MTGDGTGVVAHAGDVAVRMLADRTGLTQRLSQALRRRGFTPGHDRVRVLVDVATMITAGGEAINQAWLTLVTIAADLTAWLRLLALPEALDTCEPKALRYRFLHVPARLTRGARRRQLRLPATWP